MATAITMRPTSVTFTGTDATINADGGVTVDACSVISLNGVFTSAISNYTIIMNGVASATTERLKLRAAGVDASSDYHYQDLSLNSTSVNANRGGPETAGARRGEIYDISNVSWTNIYHPSLAQDTVMRSVTVSTRFDAYIWELGSIHIVATAYDGWSRPSGNNFTGTLHVIGYEE